MGGEKIDLKPLEENRYELDVRGYSCPYPEVFARRALEKIDSGEILELKLDNKPSCERVPLAVEEEGHECLDVDQLEKALWIIRIRKK
ncbi:hypothetical protein AKJ41_00380 [candidate division MSBL1 archaeon SCGC-AAA259O05]|nr:hypothetical protein AKJ41_00380 [candidate division MSBL1 archaeon SCGC-AAA259O05]